ncbi:MAG TPA: GNVR domain-containing protein [Geobacteraceae bacterium]
MTSPADDTSVIDPETAEVSLVDLCRIIVVRWRLVVGMTAGAALLALVASLLLPNIYSATAKVLPPQKETGGGLAAILGSGNPLAALGGGLLGGSADLYVGILKSRSVADAVIARHDLIVTLKTKTIDQTRLALEKMVKVQAGKDGIISITAESKNPQLSALLANSMVEELGRRSVQLNLSKAGTERVFLEKRLDLVKADLKRAEEALKTFAEKNRAFKVDAQTTISIESVARLRAEIVSKEVQLESQRSFQTEENQEIKSLQAALARLRGQLAQMSGGGRSADSVLPVGSVAGLGLEYARLMRELKTQEAIFELLTKQYEVTKLTEAKDSSSLQVLDDAVVPLKKSKPKRSLLVILAAVSGFMVGIVLAFISEYLTNLSDDEKTEWRKIGASLPLRRGSSNC